MLKHKKSDSLSYSLWEKVDKNKDQKEIACDRNIDLGNIYKRWMKRGVERWCSLEESEENESEGKGERGRGRGRSWGKMEEYKVIGLDRKQGDA